MGAQPFPRPEEQEALSAFLGYMAPLVPKALTAGCSGRTETLGQESRGLSLVSLLPEEQRDLRQIGPPSGPCVSRKATFPYSFSSFCASVFLLTYGQRQDCLRGGIVACLNLLLVVSS